MKGFSPTAFLRGPNWPLAALSVLILAYALATGPAGVRDSASYLAAAAYRTALYPTFLTLLGAAFGPFQLYAAVVIQILLGLCAGWRLLRSLGHQGLRGWPLRFAGALIALPYLWPLAVGNSIASEGLAYPLFLLAASELLEAVRGASPGATVRFTLWTSLGVLARPQLLFLAPAALVVIGWQHLCRQGRRSAPSWIAFASLLALGLGTALLTECSYHRWRHGHFAVAPFTDLQLMASALYVSNEEDAGALEPDQVTLFTSLRRHAADKHLLLANNPSHTGLASFAAHYGHVYNDLVWRTVVPELRKALADGQELQSGHFFEAASLLRPMAMALIRRHFVTWLRLAWSNLLQGLGSHYALLVLLTIPIAAARSPADRLASLLLAAAALHLANLGLVSLIQVARLRYTFYTDILYLASLLAFIADRRTQE